MLDWWIARRVRLRLAWEFFGLADWFAVRVRCREGHVTLSGSVRTEYRQCKAEEAARRIRSVAGVRNRITVREPSRVVRTTRVVAGPWPVPALYAVTIEEPPEADRQTSETVLRALSEQGVATGECAVWACAVGKTVYLLGSVPDEATAETAERVVAALPQVDHLRNRLQIAGSRRDTSVRG